MNLLIRKNFIKLFLYLIFTIGMALGVIAFFYLIKTKTDRVVKIREQIASYDKNKKIISEEAMQVATLENRINKLDEFIITEDNVPNMLSLLEGLAKDYNVSFEIAGLQNPIESEVKKLVIEINVLGTQQNIKDFLNKLQEQTFVVGFRQLQIFLKETATTLPTTGPQGKVTPKSSEELWQGLAAIEILSY